MILGWLPADVSTFGPNIDSMLKLIIYVVGTAFVLAEGALLAFVILYRRREGGRAAFVPGESLRELAWHKATLSPLNPPVLPLAHLSLPSSALRAVYYSARAAPLIHLLDSRRFCERTAENVSSPTRAQTVDTVTSVSSGKSYHADDYLSNRLAAVRDSS